MKKIKQSPKLPPEKRREQLLTSARKLIVKKGFRATTTEEIARNAHLTKGALYFHFKSKEDIFLELVKSISERNRSILESQLGEKISPTEFFEVLLQLHTKCDINEYGDMVDIWNQAWRVPKIRRYITRRMRSISDLFIERVTLGSGWAKKDARNLAMLIFAVVHGLSGLCMIAPRNIDMKAQVKLVTKLLTDTDRQHGRKT